MSKSLKPRILKYLRSQGGFVSGGAIERLIILKTEYTAEYGKRLCRGMAEKKADGKTPLLEKKLIKGKNGREHTWYKATDPKKVFTLDGVVVGKIW